MEEDRGVKAPVTRLRRRLSVEQPEESKSPAPSTPTKRRAGRRTAKPELELIEENATSKTPQDKTKKTVTKDLIDAIEEKPITPSRRSARIRSNTSLVSETALTLDSPRSKRAARRLSQVGSDNEAPITPARQTRKTRKDSASSIDKVENQAAVIQSNAIPEPIAEERESNNEKSITDQKDENNSSITSRKSPRLMEKISRKSTSSQIENDNNINTYVEDTNNSTGKIETTGEKIELVPSPTNTENCDHTYNKNETKVNKNERLSINSCDLLQNINYNPNKMIHTLNKSTSALESLISKNKRFRTKSYTSGTIITSNDPSTIFYSDNESSKKNDTNNARSPFKLLNKSETNESTIITERLSVCDEKNNSKQQNSTDEINSKAKIDNNQTIFDKDSSADLQVTVVIENYDSNSEKLNVNEDDQCVPEVSHIMESSSKCDTFDNSKQNKNTTIKNIPETNLMNHTCEPMDVDETITDSLLIEDAGNREGNTPNKSVRKSKSKSSIMLSLNESASQSKSTLILPHLNDTSTSEKNKSPLKLDDKCLSNTSTVLNTTQENIMHKKIKPQKYSTSTPLQQKGNEKGINLNSSNMKSNTNNDLKMSRSSLKDSESESDNAKSENIKRKPKEKKSFSKKEESSSNNSEESDNESSQKNSHFMDGEAKDAGDDYVSGDSQDEEERQAALENEIRDKGQTLSSEGDLSNDSDYEKDSFIVSSAEEDDELLEGTEDDLSMSDNELTMSAKSKNKYNERKLKEQKRASREMFESRHQSNVSKNSSVSDTKKKSKKIRQMSSSSESDIEIRKSSRVKNKQRLDSSHDITMTKDENSKTSRRSKTPSQSICNENVTMDNEKEITISNQTSTECDPLFQHTIKEEPKTPRNSNTSMAFIDAHNESTQSSSKECENLDPLATTIANDDSSMSSDNERIIQEYNSILGELDETIEKLKNKTGDISLNLETKNKKKKKYAIVDELNLTQVKSKINKTEKPNEDNEEKISANSSRISSDESLSSSESESALLHLLFSEESNNCEDSSNKTKDIDKSDHVENKSDKEFSISQTSLKTPGSDKKKKKRQSESSQNEESSNNDFNNQSNKTPASAKKNKKEQQSETSLHGKLDTSDAALNESSKTPTSTKKKKHKKSESETTSSTDAELKFFMDTEGTSTQDVSINNKSLNTSKMVVPNKDKDSSINQTLAKTPGSDKKKKKRQSESSQNEESNNNDFNNQSNKTPASAKKNKKEQLSETSLHGKLDTSDAALNESSKTPTSTKKKKHKKSESETTSSKDAELKFFVDTEGTRTQDVSINNNSLNTSKMVVPDKDKDSSINQTLPKTPGSDKKKKKRQSESSQNEESNTSDAALNESSKTPTSTKKKKHKKSKSETTSSKDAELKFFVDTEGTRTQDVSINNKSLNTSKMVVPDKANNSDSDGPMEISFRKEKNTGSKTEEEDTELAGGKSFNQSMNKTPDSSKKKKSKSNKPQTAANESNIIGNKPVINTIGSTEKKSNDPDKVQDIKNKGKTDTEQQRRKKRKRKMSTNISEGKDSRETEEINTSILNKKKKVKLTHEGNDTESSEKNKNKKRKEREDDNDETSNKAFKENSLKKLKVSRLPTSLLEQLDEKPRKQRESPKKKARLIATTNFQVEEAIKRRNKPSMYLEDSIYLNEDDNESKKNRAKNFKPKVLPFVPTASTSITGYTSNFNVNVLPKDTKFVAQSSNIQSFKTDYLYRNKIKRIGTYDMYKKSRNIKLAKY